MFQGQNKLGFEGDPQHKSFPLTEIDGCTTMASLFRKKVQQRGDKVAMREKDFGIWMSYSWNDYMQRAREVAMGLVSLGFETGDVASILSEDNKEWVWSDMGILCAGGVTNGIYPTDAAKQCAYIVNDSHTTFLFVESDEQLDKYLEMKDELPNIKKVIVFDMEGLHDFQDDMVMSFDDLRRAGNNYDKANPSLFDKRVDSRGPHDLAILVYTSGTTGAPKGAMISHQNLLFQMAAADEYLGSSPDDEILTFLPLCHILERVISVVQPLNNGATINFAESLETVPENLTEVSPTIFVAVPRIWEKFYSRIVLALKDATPIGRMAYEKAITVGMKRAKYILERQPVPAILEAQFKIADAVVLRNIRSILGLERCRFGLTGAAPISPDLVNWYCALGITMIEGYGQTESTGVATVNRPGEAKLGSIGTRVDGVDVRVDQRGEILIKGPNVFMGYLNQPEKTEETIKDGWLHSGDVGEMDDQGYFKITDRIKDIIITAGGKNITPSEIENQLKFSPYISDAVVIGDNRKFLSCLIMIDQENVEKFAQDQDVPYTNYASLCRAEQVVELIEGEISKVNKEFAQVEQVKKSRLIEQILTPEDDELTPTGKLKRSFISKKYSELIESMYA